MKSENSPKVALISLGCPKNLVDSEIALGQLQQAGFTITFDENEAEVVVINTCSFIEDAKQESIDTILEVAEGKDTGSLKQLVVMGCLAQDFGEELRRQIPEIDLVIGTGMISRIGEICRESITGKSDRSSVWIEEPDFLYTEHMPRIRATLPHAAYVKIAEGCSNCCSYCLIPRLRGKLRSRPADSIVAESRALVRQGVREINLIAQDTTAYGRDLPSGQDKLVPLLRRLAGLEGIHWIRLLYTYPDSISRELLECMAEEPRICNYLDIPIQHINDGILQAMNRRSSRSGIENTLGLIREILPDAILRTSLMVGFPGEGKKQFEELRDFAAAARFDRLGVFAFSPQEGTPAARMKDQVSRKIKEQRRNEILRLQAEISRQKNQQLVGTVQEVIIDCAGAGEDNAADPAVDDRTAGDGVAGDRAPADNTFAIGRTFGHAPDIDGAVYLMPGDIPCAAGEIHPVRIIRATDYDLFAEILK
ncbi:MAG: 30S ribosomal protein S12 methylthiotransferase RimO [bacterium]